MGRIACGILVVLGLIAVGAAAQSAEPGAANPIPGPRTCFWARGPYNADPYINVAFPDKGPFYWSANFSVPKGAHLTLRGQYARARYISFVSYRSTGQAVESLADYQIAPNRGSSNPFLENADRGASARSYTVGVDTRAHDQEAGDGKLSGAKGNLLKAPQLENSNLSVVYRIYAPDRATPVTGGVPLPEVY